MALQNDAAIKYSVYTLFCRRMMENLQALESAVEDDLDLPLEVCIQRFGAWLTEFFKEVHVSTSVASIQLFCQKIITQAKYLRTSPGGGIAAAAIFNQVASGAYRLASSWNYLSEISLYHDQGRQLAQAFFNNLSPSVPSSQLASMAQLEVEFSNTKISFGSKVAPMVTFPGANKIELRFTYEDDFPMYLSYLFLFLHEYTGHIFSNDYGNALINDGWLIFAADEFLHWLLTKGNPPLGLKPEQVFAFRRYFLEKLKDPPRAGYELAHLFYDWLDERSIFHNITYELATFTLQPGEERYWPARFFRALKNELIRGDRPELLAKIKAARDIRHLYSMLTPPKPPSFLRNS